MRELFFTFVLTLLSVSVFANDGPSFACQSVPEESIEALICEDKQLAGLDLQLSQVYQQASVEAADEHPPVLKAEQRGWIKGRDDCWKSDEISACVESAYVLRIAELQARYRLVDSNGPVIFSCNDDPRNEVIVTFFTTEPKTLIAERGDSSSLMYLQPSGSGTRYEGQNNSFWQHQDEAKLVWGYETPELSCRQAP